MELLRSVWRSDLFRFCAVFVIFWAAMFAMFQLKHAHGEHFCDLPEPPIYVSQDEQVPRTEMEWAAYIARKEFMLDPVKSNEYRLFNDRRVDILTREYAIEVDWAPKWAEGIGQACYYGIATDRKPAVLLLVKDRVRESENIEICLSTCTKYGLKVWAYDITKREWLNIGEPPPPIPC